MSVKVRPYRRSGWEVDIRVTLPDQSEHRLRRKAPVASKSAAQRWEKIASDCGYRNSRSSIPRKAERGGANAERVLAQVLGGACSSESSETERDRVQRNDRAGLPAPLLGDRPLDGI